MRVGGNLGRFLLVGLSGLAVNSGIFLLVDGVYHVHYLVAAILSTQVSTTWNFLLAEGWVYSHRDLGAEVGSRFLKFAAVNNVSLLLRGPTMVLLISLFAIPAALANLIGLTAITLLRFGIADVMIWSTADDLRKRLYRYRIHGEVSVESEVTLPELEGFRAERTHRARPTDRGAPRPLTGEQSDLVSTLASLVRHVRYREGLGRLGFGVEIASGTRRSTIAAPAAAVLAARALHEHRRADPALDVRRARLRARARRVHGRRRARALLITARTDTGKTTTILKTLDRHRPRSSPTTSTLVRPDGQVLDVPEAADHRQPHGGSGEAPLLAPRRSGCLPVQSRIHRRTGRPVRDAHRAVAPARGDDQRRWSRRSSRRPSTRSSALVPGVAAAPGGAPDRHGDHPARRATATSRRSTRRPPTLLENCADAYGFPPYPCIEPLPPQLGTGATCESSEQYHPPPPSKVVRRYAPPQQTMDWWQRIPDVIGLTRRPEVLVHPLQSRK